MSEILVTQIVSLPVNRQRGFGSYQLSYKKLKSEQGLFVLEHFWYTKIAKKSQSDV